MSDTNNNNAQELSFEERINILVSRGQSFKINN